MGLTSADDHLDFDFNQHKIGSRSKMTLAKASDIMTTINALGILLVALMFSAFTSSAQAANTQTVNKTALAGQTINLMNYATVNPDCTAGDPVTIKITEQPSHGKAVESNSDVFPSFPPTNPRFVCNRMKFPSTLVQYTAPEGFSGTDVVTVELFTASGGDSELKYLITVK